MNLPREQQSVAAYAASLASSPRFSEVRTPGHWHRRGETVLHAPEVLRRLASSYR